jgi:hypothetical protein
VPFPLLVRYHLHAASDCHAEASEAACQLSLPCVGVFLLEACTDDELSSTDDSQRACATLELGEVAGLSFTNPWHNVTALLLWGNNDDPALRGNGTGGIGGLYSRSQLLRGVPHGAVTVALPMRSECRTGCSVALLLSVPRSDSAFVPPEGVRVSKLFDPAAGHTHVLRLSGGSATMNSAPALRAKEVRCVVLQGDQTRMTPPPRRQDLVNNLFSF